MVLRNRGRQFSFGPEGPQHVAIEDQLAGVVLEIQAINLPFLFVIASCPIRGQQNLLVDSRKYDFIRVNKSFAMRVISSLNQGDDNPSDGLEGDSKNVIG